MNRDAVILTFPGDPQQIARAYADGIRRFSAERADARPDACFIGTSDRQPNALVVTLLWPAGVSHEHLGRFLLARLAELGLPRPSQVDHINVIAAGWDAVGAVS
jgi:hypothetical protein